MFLLHLFLSLSACLNQTQLILNILLWSLVTVNYLACGASQPTSNMKEGQCTKYSAPVLICFFFSDQTEKAKLKVSLCVFEGRAVMQLHFLNRIKCSFMYLSFLQLKQLLPVLFVSRCFIQVASVINTQKKQRHISYTGSIVQQELGTGVMTPETSLMQGGDSVHGESVHMEALQGGWEDKTVRFLSHVIVNGASVNRKTDPFNCVHLGDEASEVEQSALVCGLMERSPVRPGVLTHKETNVPHRSC